MKTHNLKDKLFLCTIVMEHTLPTTEKIFNKKSADDLIVNTKLFVQFVHRIIESYYILNFKGKTYHGDIKPPNQMYLWNKAGELEPKMIDFDISFTMSDPKFNPKYIPYTWLYRSRELRLFSAKTNPSARELAAFAKYTFDPEFKEEAWAVAKMIKAIVDTNKEYLNAKDLTFRKVLLVVEKMYDEDVKARLSNEQAYFEISKFLEKLRVII